MVQGCSSCMVPDPAARQVACGCPERHCRGHSSITMHTLLPSPGGQLAGIRSRRCTCPAARRQGRAPAAAPAASARPCGSPRRTPRGPGGGRRPGGTIRHGKQYTNLAKPAHGKSNAMVRGPRHPDLRAPGWRPTAPADHSPASGPRVTRGPPPQTWRRRALRPPAGSGRDGQEPRALTRGWVLHNCSEL